VVTPLPWQLRLVQVVWLRTSCFLHGFAPNFATKWDNGLVSSRFHRRSNPESASGRQGLGIFPKLRCEEVKRMVIILICNNFAATQKDVKTQMSATVLK